MNIGKCIAAIGAVGFAVSAQAATYDLAGDWSDSVNPNGAWSFVQGSTALAHQTSCTPSNPFSASVGNGFWGAGCNLDTNTPEIARVTADGVASGQTLEDWLAGDVVLHSTNPGTGAPIAVHWTAPSAGTIDYAVAAWYAHSGVTRSNDLTITLNGSLLHSGVVTNGGGRSNAINFSGNLGVLAGDILAVSFQATSGQTFGSLAGLNQTVVFTAAVPEPETWALLAGGLGIVGLTVRRRRSHA